MAHPDLFRIAADHRQAREAAERLFEAVKQQLQAVLPATTEVLHVGATAIPGCLTKGDLDIVVRVERKDFQAVEATLSARFARNPGSTRTEEFAAFEDEVCTPHLGIQLTAKGGALDVFHRFAAALRADPALVSRYNTLKIAHDGQPMDCYRAAKDAFVADALLHASSQPSG
ncbi:MULTISPECIES: GrpB family protein [unclassified Bradyrhizobium]|uniref:GrpB family protein n=1 Tax=unclassified Bradyrhizobium TaxID=2631580 RepID=UPI0028E8258D|nr:MULTISPECIES: GrpB family protein [unclassified Bradyrhizobium]